MTMRPSYLVDRLDVPWGWFGPTDGNVDRPSKWKSSLITSAMVRGLLDAEPWVLVRVPLPPV